MIYQDMMIPVGQGRAGSITFCLHSNLYFDINQSQLPRAPALSKEQIDRHCASNAFSSNKTSIYVPLLASVSA